MELIRRNIHMDRVKRSTVMQFTMEEDLNLPEDKPDISTLNLEKGEVVIEEIRPGTDEVTVRGKLGYAILYHTQEAGSNLVLLSGALPHVRGTDDGALTVHDFLQILLYFHSGLQLLPQLDDGAYIAPGEIIHQAAAGKQCQQGKEDEKQLRSAQSRGSAVGGKTEIVRITGVI